MAGTDYAFPLTRGIRSVSIGPDTVDRLKGGRRHLWQQFIEVGTASHTPEPVSCLAIETRTNAQTHQFFVGWPDGRANRKGRMIGNGFRSAYHQPLIEG